MSFVRNLQKLTMVFCTALVSLNALAAGGGEGFNGPVLNATSIPVKLDRGIQAAEAKAAVLTCLVYGDASRGLTSYMSRFSQLILGASVTGASPSTYWNIGTNWKFMSDPGSFKAVSPDRIGAVTNKGDIVLHPDPSYGYDLYHFLSDVPLIAFNSSNTLPTANFGRLMANPIFDDLGNIDESTIVLSDVTIEVPGNLVSDGYKLKFKNRSTGQILKAELDTTEYIACLKSELESRGASR